MKRRSDLTQPRGGISLGVHYDPDAFGRFSESIARFIGTARFLVLMTVMVVAWIVTNSVSEAADFDPYPYILLTLALSLQASYAAPLILLAQNRQAERDRAAQETDRDTRDRLLADTEYLARELAAIRVALADMVTTRELERLFDESRGEPAV